MFTDTFNIKALCIFLNVSRSGYYKWLKRKGLINRYEQNRKDLMQIVPNIHKKDVTMGYRAINSWILDNYGWIVSDWLVHKVCRELGIVSRARRKWRRPKNEHLEYPNLIWKDWAVNKPFEKIVSDTTSFFHKKTGKMYELTFFVDVFNHEIVGYAVGNYNHGHNKITHFEALKKMLEEKKKRGYTTSETILHTDQGGVYASRDFKEAHKNYNIIRSMSRSGTPTDNPIIESFNSWFKPLLFLTFKINQHTDYIGIVAECVKYWNNERKTYKIAYKNPVQYRTELGFI